MAQSSDQLPNSVALIGMGCRFPGGIDSPDDLWAFLHSSGDAISDVPADRWSLESFFDPEPGKKGKIYTRRGGFLDDVRGFDPKFFGLSPREANSMDPQQRLLLETTWEALEDGGVRAEKMRGSSTGVFVGMFVHDYENLHSRSSEYALFGPHSATGTSTTIAANRISHCFDLRGPSMVVDTACSSSLVALHLACRSLLSGESSLALAGGANTILRPEMSMLLCQAGMLSPGGACRSFDARADGYVRAEGVGMLVLKRLEDAERDGDPIRAVIRATAMNQDGGGQGLTVPSADSQKRVIDAALTASALEPSRIDYVEAHGTGTPVGDPVECEAIGANYGNAPGRKGRCMIGSVKSNIGHTESAAGIAGLMKLVLMLERRTLLPNCHFSEPNPGINFEELNLEVSTSLAPWEASQLRTGAVNSFGFGGTNAHAIVQEYSPHETAGQTKASSLPFVFPVSADTSEALAAVATNLKEFLSTNSIPSADLAHSLAFHKGRHRSRAALVADSTEQLCSGLSALAKGEPTPTARVGTSASNSPAKIGFVYSGMGQQWPAMGRELFEKEPVFRAVIERCDRELAKHTDRWRLAEELLAPESRSRLGRSEIAQPCLFAVQAGLTALWKSIGVRPECIVAHSAGEVAAFHAAGVLNLEDAVRVSYIRGLLQDRLAGSGTMLAVGLSAEEAEARLENSDGTVSVAAINSPTSVTLSGGRETLESIARDLEKEKVFARFVPVDIPYHGPAMHGILDELRSRLSDLNPQEASIPLVSSVTGDFLNGTDADAEYWCRNVREPVAFLDAFRSLIRTGTTVSVEIAAHPVLSMAMQENLKALGDEGTVIATLRRNTDAVLAFRSSAAELYCYGIEPDWAMLNGYGRFHRLPAYPFQREIYWEESEESESERIGLRFAGGGSIVDPLSHPLLGGRLTGPDSRWRGELELSRLSYLGDHRVDDTIIFPGAAGIEMLLAAARDSRPESRPTSLENLRIASPIVMAHEKHVPVETQFRNDEISVYSCSSASQWSQNFSGRLSERHEKELPTLDLSSLRRRLPVPMEREAIYERFARIGLNYGDRFRRLNWIQTGNGEALGEISRNEQEDTEQAGDYVIHPAILDTCFQVAAILPDEGTYLPVGVDRFTVFETPVPPLYAWAQLTGITPKKLRANLLVSNKEGKILLSVEGLTCHRSDVDERDSSTIDNLLHTSDWIESTLEKGQSPRNASFFPTPRCIGNQLSDWIKEDSSRLRRAHYYEVVEPDLDRLSSQYIVSAFRDLGFEFATGSTFSIDEMRRSLGVVDRHTQLFERLFNILAEDGFLEMSGTAGWAVSQTPGQESPGTIWGRLLFEHPDLEAEFLLLARCGERLAKVLKGDENPLGLIFPPQSPVAEQLYRDSPTFRPYKRIIRKAVSSLIDSVPEERTLRVLEVGAGTGSLGSYILPLFPLNRTEYHFTDLSLGFTNQAQKRFAHFPFLTFSIFDLERDAEPQGFDARSFDLILASDVVHATRDLRQTLGRLRELLVPGGHLVMTESTHSPRWFDIVFGMLEGWWLFRDFDVRPSHATIPFQKWDSLLKETGFAEIEGLSDPVEHPLQTVIVAQVPRQEISKLPEIPSSPIVRPVAVFPDAGGFWQKLAPFFPEAVAFGEAHKTSNGSNVTGENSHDPFKGLEQSTDILFLQDLDYREDPADAKQLEEALTRSTLRHLKAIQILEGRDWKDPPTLWWITVGAEKVSDDSRISLLQSTSRGLARVAASELSPLAVRHIDLSSFPTKEEIAALLAEIAHGTDEEEIALRGSKRYVSRLVRTRPTREGGEFRIAVGQEASSSQFQLLEASLAPPASGEVKIELASAGLNFKDVARLTGLIPDNAEEDEEKTSFGLECSGTVVSCGTDVNHLEPGDRVMGLVRGAFSSHVIGDVRHLTKIPDRLSFEEAATIPVAYLSAWYSLVTLAGIGKGDIVLVHTASGGLGLAAIQVARSRDARVLATAGSPEKRRFLRRLGIEYVGDSRSLEFADEIRDLLKGDCVDIIVNTLPGEAIEKGLALLKPVSGRFIDLANLHSDYHLPLSSLKRGVRFDAFDLETIICQETELVKEILEAIASAIEKRELHPLPYRSFSCRDAFDAFDLLQSSRHIGKIILSFRGEDVSPLFDSSGLPGTVDPDGTYLITGGLGGFGLATARWLVDCGVRHVILVGRTGVNTEAVQQVIADIEANGSQVTTEIADVTDVSRMREVIERIDESGGTLKGVFHAAMVLEDVGLKKMTPEQMTNVLLPKAIGGWILDQLTKDHDLDFFISYSSFSSTVGASDQGNYAAANAFLDSLAHYQRLRGTRGHSVSWGGIGKVGYVSGNSEITGYFRRQGVFLVSPEQSWKVLSHMIENEIPHTTAVSIDWDRFARYNPEISKNPRFSFLISEEPRSEDVQIINTSVRHISEDPVQRLAALKPVLTKVVENLLGVSEGGVPAEIPLSELGFDSLMAVELALRIRESTTVELPRMTLLSSGLNVDMLAGMVSEELGRQTTPASARGPAPVENEWESLVDELEENEIDEMLGEILDAAN